MFATLAILSASMLVISASPDARPVGANPEAPDLQGPHITQQFRQTINALERNPSNFSISIWWLDESVRTRERITPKALKEKWYEVHVSVENLKKLNALTELLQKLVTADLVPTDDPIDVRFGFSIQAKTHTDLPSSDIYLGGASQHSEGYINGCPAIFPDDISAHLRRIVLDIVNVLRKDQAGSVPHK